MPETRLCLSLTSRQELMNQKSSSSFINYLSIRTTGESGQGHRDRLTIVPFLLATFSLQ